MPKKSHKKHQQDPDPAPGADAEAPAQDDAAPAPDPVPPLDVLYCGVCSYPPEYCEFNASLTRCKDWLLEHHPKLHDKYYSDAALAEKIGTLSLEKQEKLEQDIKKKERKHEAKMEEEAKRKRESVVTIKRLERTKRKHVTSIANLDAFNIDLKKAAKQLAGKFATGASVSKTPEGKDEIVVQGDVCYEVAEMIEEGVGVLKGVPGDNVVVDEGKKKG